MRCRSCELRQHRIARMTWTEGEVTAPKMSEQRTKNRSKIDEKPCQIDQKLTKNRSWAVLGTQGRFGDTSGSARDGLWTAKCHPKADLETPRGGQERPRGVQKRPRAAPQTLPDRPGAVSERVWSIEHHRARLRCDFSSILCCHAEVPMCENLAPANVLYISHEMNTDIAKNMEIM